MENESQIGNLQTISETESSFCYNLTSILGNLQVYQQFQNFLTNEYVYSIQHIYVTFFHPVNLLGTLKYCQEEHSLKLSFQQ